MSLNQSHAGAQEPSCDSLNVHCAQKRALHRDLAKNYLRSGLDRFYLNCLASEDPEQLRSPRIQVNIKEDRGPWSVVVDGKRVSRSDARID